MTKCILALCAGVALTAAAPHHSFLRIIGVLLFAGAAVALVALFARSLVRSLRTRSLHGTQLLAALIIALLAAFAVQCLSPSSNQAQIERMIGVASTSTDPSLCRELLTPRYLRQITGSGPPFADDICASEAPTRAVRRVDIGRVSVEGDHATALVSYSGGSLDGSEVVMRLTREDGGWKLDRVASFVRFDRRRFSRAYWRRFLELGAPAQAADCAIEAERRFSNAELERALLRSAQRTFVPIAVACDRLGTKQRILAAVADPQLDLGRAGIECAERKLDSASQAELVRLELDTVTYGEFVLSCDRTAFVDSVKHRLAAAGDLSAGETSCVVEAVADLPPAGVIRLTYDQARFASLIDGCRDRA
jgi:hypothetical protein